MPVLTPQTIFAMRQVFSVLGRVQWEEVLQSCNAFFIPSCYITSTVTSQTIFAATSHVSSVGRGSAELPCILYRRLSAHSHPSVSPIKSYRSSNTVWARARRQLNKERSPHLSLERRRGNGLIWHILVLWLPKVLTLLRSPYCQGYDRTGCLQIRSLDIAGWPVFTQTRRADPKPKRAAMTLLVIAWMISMHDTCIMIHPRKCKNTYTYLPIGENEGRRAIRNDGCFVGKKHKRNCKDVEVEERSRYLHQSKWGWGRRH